MSEYQYGVEHRRPDGNVNEIRVHEAELLARHQVARCHEGGSPCVLVRREVGPWVPVEAGSE